jgi:hypothetical protein
VAVVAGAVLARDGAPAAACRSTLIPAYTTPAGIRALADGPRRPRLVIVNPDSGPGDRRDAAYAKAVERARRAGMRVLGYVATGYGARPAADVGADVDRYAAWYGVDGIFLDESAHTADLVGHYRELAARARGGAGRLVVLNPGVVPVPGYLDVADVVVTFEGHVAQYDAALASAPAWLEQLPAKRVAHLVYGASRAEAMAAVGAGGHAGYFYVTSGTLPNPWQTVPEYLAAQEARLAGCAS